MRIDAQIEPRAQRLIDPQACSACLGCYEVCPHGAVVFHNRRVAIDPTLCNDCGDCAAQCASDAIQLIDLGLGEVPYDVDEQLAWESLPISIA